MILSVFAFKQSIASFSSCYRILISNLSIESLYSLLVWNLILVSHAFIAYFCGIFLSQPSLAPFYSIFLSHFYVKSSYRILLFSPCAPFHQILASLYCILLLHPSFRSTALFYWFLVSNSIKSFYPITMASYRIFLSHSSFESLYPIYRNLLSHPCIPVLYYVLLMHPFIASFSRILSHRIPSFRPILTTEGALSHIFLIFPFTLHASYSVLYFRQ